MLSSQLISINAPAAIVEDLSMCSQSQRRNRLRAPDYRLRAGGSERCARSLQPGVGSPESAAGRFFTRSHMEESIPGSGGSGAVVRGKPATDYCRRIWKVPRSLPRVEVPVILRLPATGF